MQIAGGNGAFPVNATAGHGVAINDGVLLEVGLASQTGELMLGHCLPSLRVQQEVAERDRLLQMKAPVPLAIWAAVGSSQWHWRFEVDVAIPNGDFSPL